MTTDITARVQGDREIIASGELDAAAPLVWQMFTDPGHLAHWWGPSGFRTITRHMDVRPAGVWRFVMNGPDGQTYDNVITYLEVSDHHCLVYKHGGDKDLEPVNFQVTVLFEPLGSDGARSRITLRSLFPTMNAREFVIREYNAVEGGRQSLQRLGEYLHMLQAGGVPGVDPSDLPFVITRVMAATPEAVWRAWTDPVHLARWFGPKGVTIPGCTLDLRPGGIFHYCMQVPNGPTLWGKWIFREIRPPERLSFVSTFSDPEGGLTRHPMSAQWPLETLSTVTFAEHTGKGQGTTVVVSWIPIRATPEERRTFDDAHESMRLGWRGTLDQLDAYLREARGEP